MSVDILIKEKKGFQVFWNCRKQTYDVFKNGKFLIGNKFSWRDVKGYVA